MKRIVLITGAFGFVGGNLSRSLRQAGYELWALDVADGGGEYSCYFSWEELDGIPWDEVGTVVHLAGKAHDTKNESEAAAYFEINTGLTKRVFDRFIRSGAGQFILFSSVKAAADSVPPDTALTEQVVPHAVGPYAASKLAAEQYVLAALDARSLPEDQRIYVFRPCMIHGPGNKGNLNLLYSVVSRGIPWPLGAFDNRRSMLGVDNAAWFVERFIAQGPPSGIYNLSDDEPLSTNRLIALIAASVGRRVRIWRWNKSLMNAVAGVGGICRLPLNPERLRKLTESYVVSNLKARRALGVDALPVGAEEGIERTLKSFQR